MSRAVFPSQSAHVRMASPDILGLEVLQLAVDVETIACLHTQQSSDYFSPV